jgi:hypothetical protein
MLWVFLAVVIGKNGLTLNVGGWQYRSRVKSVWGFGREFHLTLFPQGNRERKIRSHKA